MSKLEAKRQRQELEKAQTDIIMKKVDEMTSLDKMFDKHLAEYLDIPWWRFRKSNKVFRKVEDTWLKLKELKEKGL